MTEKGLLYVLSKNGMGKGRYWKMGASRKNGSI